MARYLADQNKVLGIHESGTYGTVSTATGSVFWIGEVTENSISDEENLLENRFLGTSTRNFDTMELGPRDVTGTLTYNMQDTRLPFWAIGSLVEWNSAGSNVHIAAEAASDVWQSPFTSGTGQHPAPISFTIQDSKQAPGTNRNFIRTIDGVVPNTVTITASQGEKVVCAVDYIGQTLTFTPSGTTASGTAIQNTDRPYLWSDCSLTIAGSSMDTAKEISLEINNNLEAPHYLDGTRDIATPFAQNREYTLNVTMDLDAQDANWLYGEKYKAGSEFTAVFDMDGDVAAVGSQHTVFTMSNCVITSMENPSTSEGVTETTLEIRPKSVAGSTWDTAGSYNPW